MRHTTKHQSARCASVVHTFWPVMTHSSPSRTARVWMLARSEPAFGSEKPWHHNSSTDWIFGRKRRFCSSVPNWMSVGANRPSPKNETRAGALARAYSSLKITCCGERERPAAVLLRPRHADPAVGAEHPLPLEPDVPAGLVGGPAARARARRTPRSGGSASQARTSARKAASSGVSTEVHGGGTLLDRPVWFPGDDSRVDVPGRGCRRSSESRSLPRPDVGFGRARTSTDPADSGIGLGFPERAGGRIAAGLDAAIYRGLVPERAVRQRREAHPLRRRFAGAQSPTAEPDGLLRVVAAATAPAARAGRVRAGCTRSW